MLAATAVRPHPNIARQPTATHTSVHHPTSLPAYPPYPSAGPPVKLLTQAPTHLPLAPRTQTRTPTQAMRATCHGTLTERAIDTKPDFNFTWWSQAALHIAVTHGPTCESEMRDHRESATFLAKATKPRHVNNEP